VRFAVKNLIVLISLASAVYAQFTQTAFSQTANTDEQEIRKTMDQLEQAFVSRTPGPFLNYYLDGYVNIREKPVYNYREQLSAMVKWDAAAIKAGKPLNFETLSYDSEPPSIHLYGDSAVVNTLKKNLWRYKDDKCLTRYQTTELWIKTEGVWKIATAHMTTMQCDQMPWQPPHPAVSEIRSQSKPTKFLSTTAETELRELLSKLSDSGLRSDTNADAFASSFVSTDTNSNLSSDRGGLINALKIPTIRNRERYRDDEVFLSFGNAAIYLFRVRSFPKAGETTPPPPTVYSVMFVKSASDWKIAAVHASEISD
jgi:hypothetical protein